MRVGNRGSYAAILHTELQICCGLRTCVDAGWNLGLVLPVAAMKQPVGYRFLNTEW